MNKSIYSNSQIIRLASIVLVIMCVLSSGELMAVNSEDLAANDTIVHTDSELPMRGIFYYAWYPNTWKPNGYHVQYQPTIGYYTSTD